MEKLDPPQRKATEVAAIPFARVTRLLQQLTHDIRNEFGALDLEAAYIVQAATDPTTAAEATRLRNIVAEAVLKLKRLSVAVSPLSLNPTLCPATMFAGELRTRFSKTWPMEVKNAEWNFELGQENLLMDFELMASAFAKIFENAFQFREDGLRIDFRGYPRGTNVVFEFIETKRNVPSPPERWGMEPFVSTRRDGYGLGLFFVRRVIEAHQGRLAIRHDAERGVLITQAVLPVEKV